MHLYARVRSQYKGLALGTTALPSQQKSTSHDKPGCSSNANAIAVHAHCGRQSTTIG